MFDVRAAPHADRREGAGCKDTPQLHERIRDGFVRDVHQGAHRPQGSECAGAEWQPTYRRDDCMHPYRAGSLGVLHRQVDPDDRDPFRDERGRVSSRPDPDLKDSWPTSIQSRDEAGASPHPLWIDRPFGPIARLLLVVRGQCPLDCTDIAPRINRSTVATPRCRRVSRSRRSEAGAPTGDRKQLSERRSYGAV